MGTSGHNLVLSSQLRLESRLEGEEAGCFRTFGNNFNSKERHYGT